MDNKLARIVIINLPVIFFFYLLYTPLSPRPYSNIIYFAGLAVLGIASIREYHWVKHGHWKWLGVGIFSMCLFYLAMRLGFSFVAGSQIPIGTDKWSYFVEPWQRISLLISFPALILVVVSMELFYRGYVQETLCKYFNVRHAILVTSLLSAIRGSGVGLMPGFIDFILALAWGLIYSEAGLLPAIATHLCWDILFVYFPP
ncbi:MAG: CPBP family intramembrane glutamic endopeptidase [Candidatus Hydrothermarchaeales archaeon]